MDRLEQCDLAYVIRSVFRLQKVTFMTTMSPNSVTDQATKEVLLSLTNLSWSTLHNPSWVKLITVSLGTKLFQQETLHIHGVGSRGEWLSVP